MIESVSGQKMVEQAEQAIEKEAQVKQPGEEDVQRFEHAIGADSGTNVQTSGIPREQMAAPVSQTPESMGDAILQSFQKLRTTHQDKVEKIQASLESMQGRDFSPQELLKVQWELAQTTFELETTTKVVDKADQGVSTLLRSQS
jgi:type III secretion system YscI/HrpB-like protein